MAEDVVPSTGMLGPQGSTDVEQQARRQVQERGGGCQHLLDRPYKLLRLQGGRRGEEANALPIDHMAAGYRGAGIMSIRWSYDYISLMGLCLIYQPQTQIKHVLFL